MLVYSTANMLNANIECINSSIINTAVLIVLIMTAVLIVVSISAVEYRNSKKAAKELAEIKAAREAVAVKEAPVVVREAVELIANIEDNNISIYRDMNSLYEAIEEVENNASSRSVLNLKCIMGRIASSIIC